MSLAIFLALFSVRAAATGLVFPLQVKWSATLPAGPGFAPAYDADFAYLSLRNNQLVAVRLADGTTAWSVDALLSAAPAAGDGLVFAGSAGHIDARSQKDGSVQWRRPVEGRIASLYWDAGWLVASVEAGTVLAIRAIDGEVLWQRQYGAPIHAAPAPAGDRLYLPLRDGRLMAVSLTSGGELWTQTLGEAAVGILALADRLYVGSLDNYLYCLDAEDGGIEWRWRTGADLLGLPVIDTRRIYFIALDNVLRAHDRRNGSLIWNRVLPMRPSTGPLLSGNTLVVSGVATELHAYGLDGVPAGTYGLKGTQGEEVQLAAPPHLAPQDVLIVTTRGGQLHALTSGAQPTP